MAQLEKTERGYYLALVTSVADPAPSAAITLNLISRLTDEEFITYQNCIQALAQYEASERLIACVRCNLDDLKNAITYHGMDFLEARSTNAENMARVAFDLGRLLANVLASFKAVVDHGETYLTRRYGENSRQLLDWKNAQSTEFDTVFAYRFFCNLRNYVQHIDAAPLLISFQATRDETRISMRADFDSAQLLKDARHMFRHSEKELNSPDLISLIELIAPWLASFDRIADLFLECRARESLQGARKLIDAAAGHPNEADLIIASVDLIDLTAGALNCKMHHLHLPTAKRIVGRLLSKPVNFSPT